MSGSALGLARWFPAGLDHKEIAVCQGQICCQGGKLNLAACRRAIGIEEHFAGVSLVNDALTCRGGIARGIGDKAVDRQNTPRKAREYGVFNADLVSACRKNW